MATVALPEVLSRVGPAVSLPQTVFRRLANEEIVSYLIAFGEHAAWKTRDAVVRPASGSVYLFDRIQTKLFRKDGYDWKKRKGGTSIREDHMKLMVHGVKCLYGCYAHAADGTPFHRRTYWLVQHPGVVLVHYLDERDCLSDHLSLDIAGIASGDAEADEEGDDDNGENDADEDVHGGDDAFAFFTEGLDAGQSQGTQPPIAELQFVSEIFAASGLDHLGSLGGDLSGGAAAVGCVSAPVTWNAPTGIKTEEVDLDWTALAAAVTRADQVSASNEQRMGLHMDSVAQQNNLLLQAFAAAEEQQAPQFQGGASLQQQQGRSTHDRAPPVPVVTPRRRGRASNAGSIGGRMDFVVGVGPGTGGGVTPGPSPKKHRLSLPFTHSMDTLMGTASPTVPPEPMQQGPFSSSSSFVTASRESVGESQPLGQTEALSQQSTPMDWIDAMRVGAGGGIVGDGRLQQPKKSSHDNAAKTAHLRSLSFGAVESPVLESGLTPATASLPGARYGAGSFTQWISRQPSAKQKQQQQQQPQQLLQQQQQQPQQLQFQQQHQLQQQQIKQLQLQVQQKPRVVDFSPDSCNVGVGVKVLLIGQFGPMTASYRCSFGGVSVPAEAIQEGVLRCNAPAAPAAGKVALTVHRDDCSDHSTAVWFEYRQPTVVTALPEWLVVDAPAFRARLVERVRLLECLSIGGDVSSLSPVDPLMLGEVAGVEDALVAAVQRIVVSVQVSSIAEQVGAGSWGANLGGAGGRLPPGSTHATDPKGMTALHLACSLGLPRLAGTLKGLYDAAAESPGLRAVADAHNFNPDEREVRMRRFLELVAAETETTALDFARCSALQWACVAGSFDIAKVLVSADASVLSLRDAWNRSPAEIARTNNHTLLADALATHGRSDEASATVAIGGLSAASERRRTSSDVSSKESRHSRASSFSFNRDDGKGSPLLAADRDAPDVGLANLNQSAGGVSGKGMVAEMWADVMAGSSSGLLDREFSELTLRDRDYIELYRAARIIQSAFRDYKGSQRRKQMVDAAVVIQSHFRRYKEGAKIKQMHEAAARIQNRYRTYRQHLHFLESKHAAVTIQRQFRERRERKQRMQSQVDRERRLEAHTANRMRTTSSSDVGSGSTGDNRDLPGGRLSRRMSLTDFSFFAASGTNNAVVPMQCQDASSGKDNALAQSLDGCLDLSNFAPSVSAMGV